VRLTRDEDGEPLAALLSVKPHGDFHRQLGPDRFQIQDELVEADREVSEVDQHGHDEESLHDLLIDVLDVDAALRQVRRHARDDPLLVATDDGHDGRTRGGHRGTVAKRTPGGNKAARR
jgi:hypothetical protein